VANTLNITSIPAPRVPFIDERTGLMAREWYRFFLNLFILTGSGSNPTTLDELQIGPPNQPDLTELLIQINKDIAPQYEDQSGDFLKTLDTAQLMSMMSQFANAEAAIQGAYLQPAQLPVDGIYVVGPGSSTDNAVARFDGTTGKLIQNSVTTIDDTGNASGILSQQFSDGTAVTLAAGKLWYNGTTGSWNGGMGNGNITQQIGEEIFIYGKASAAITDSPLQIIYKTGVVGASGVIQFAPTVAGITEADQILGIATESLAHNAFGRITTFGIVRAITTNGTAFGEVWADNDDIYYNPVTGNPTKTKPVAPNIKVQLGTIINAGSGGSGSFFVSIGSSSTLGGTDSNVQFGALANNNLIAYDSAVGYWKNVTASSIGLGTVTSVAALTLGTTGTDLSSTVANGTTTPVITLQVPTASASNRGALSAADWTTFNNKGSGTVISVAATVPSIFSISGSPITTSGTLAMTYSGTALPVANGGTGNATGTATINANLTGPITSVGNATSITAGAIVNADINAAAGIVDTKLATIATALKVSNSATTATSANAANAIVARDASGNFSGGIVTVGRLDGPLNGTVGATTPASIAGTTGTFSSGLTVSGGRTFLAAASETFACGVKYVSTGGAFYFGAASGSGTPDAVFSNSGGAERMRISDTGIVTMSAYGAGAATFSAAGVISSVSDETWKVKDGAPVDTDAMLNKLEPGYWYYNDEKKETFGADRQLGFYAQNVNAAIGSEAAPEPETVTTKNEDGTETSFTKPWGYYDRSVLAVTVMSLQKALATIESLTARITALEAKG